MGENALTDTGQARQNRGRSKPVSRLLKRGAGLRFVTLLNAGLNGSLGAGPLVGWQIVDRNGAKRRCV